jgi:hypothetical protein
MTEPRRRTPTGRRDAERLLDGHGRRAAHPSGVGTDPWSSEDPAAILAALLADAAASPRHVDPGREREVLQHFRAAFRHAAAPRPRGVRQRVAALSATAKVLSVAVGATATGGVALASASVPLGHGLRPFTSHTADAPAGSDGPDRDGTPGSPTSAGTATTVRQSGPGGPAGSGDGDGRRDGDRRRSAVPGPAPTGFPELRNPATVPTPPATTPPTSGPTTEPTFDFSLPPDDEPTTDPPISRAPPGFEEPPPEDLEPTPTEDAGTGHPDPSPSATRTTPQ